MRFLTLILFLLSATAWSQQQDPFDAIDRQLDAAFNDADRTIDARFTAVEEAVDRAFRGLTRKIEVHWGADARMPDRSRWVTYSAEHDSRVSVDYASGEMVVEAIVVDPQKLDVSLEKMANLAGSLLDAKLEELNARDSLLVEIRQEMADAQLAPPDTDNDHRSAPPSPELAEILPATEIKQTLARLQTIELSGEALRVDPTVPAAVISSDAVIVEDELAVIVEDEPAAILEDTTPLPELQLIEVGGIQKLQLRFPFVSGAQQKLIESQLDTIRAYSSEYDVPVSLILAVIETESSFNPRAVSPIPAFGLMQLVPRTAGIDAYQRVHGEKKVVSAEFLFNEINNIELGTAYLNIVRDSYLRHIEDPHSRFYCTVAAYNTGVGNVARSFGGSKNLRSAARRINGMTSDEVYRHLLAELPAEETKNYLRKIVSRQGNYRHLDVG